jgi:hypothetical protein
VSNESSTALATVLLAVAFPSVSLLNPLVVDLDAVNIEDNGPSKPEVTL